MNNPCSVDGMYWLLFFDHFNFNDQTCMHVNKSHIKIDNHRCERLLYAARCSFAHCLFTCSSMNTTSFWPIAKCSGVRYDLLLKMNKSWWREQRKPSAAQRNMFAASDELQLLAWFSVVAKSNRIKVGRPNAHPLTPNPFVCCMQQLHENLSNFKYFAYNIVKR